MSQEIVDFVKAVLQQRPADYVSHYADQARVERQARVVDGALDPDFETRFVGPRDPRGALAGFDGVVTTYDGFKDHLRRWLAGWKRFAFEPEEYIDLGRRVLVLTRFSGETAAGEQVEIEGALLVTVAGGRVAASVWSLDRARTVAEAGVSL